MVSLEQDVLLVLDVLYLLLLKEQVFVDALHCVHLAHLAVVDEEDFTKAALVDYFTDLEVLKIYTLTVQTWLANKAGTTASILQGLLLLQVFSGVVLPEVRGLQDDKVVKNFVIHIVPGIILTTTFSQDLSLAPIQKEFFSWHSGDAIGKVTLACQVALERRR